MCDQLNRKWYDVVKTMCLIRNIRIDDINPDDLESLKLLQMRIIAAF